MKLPISPDFFYTRGSCPNCATARFSNDGQRERGTIASWKKYSRPFLVVIIISNIARDGPFIRVVGNTTRFIVPITHAAHTIETTPSYFTRHSTLYLF